MRMTPRATLAAWAAAALFVAATPSSGQTSRNATLLGTFDPTSTYNDVWGYVDAATGNEYAILGSTSNTYIVDCTNASQPVQRGVFPGSLSGWSSSTWRDMKTHKKHAYVVTEGGGGMQIIDLTNPDNPQYVKTWGANIWRSCHNIAMDEGTGIAYVCGTNSGMHIIDCDTDPKNPQLITTYYTPYIHDLHVQNGRLHGADIYNNNYLILDVSNLPSTTTLGRVRAPGTRYCHNNWASKDDQFSVTTNESSGGPIAVYDIRTITSPLLIRQFRPPATSSIPHNAFIRDRMCLASHYTEGFQAFDMTDPLAGIPTLGWYDTYPGTSGGYNGAWGLFPFTDSGNVYVSDISGGMFIVKPRFTPTRYGAGTAGTGGIVPEMRQFGGAYLGNPRFGFALANARPNAGATLVLGLQRASLNASGLSILVIPLALFPATADGNGYAKLTIPVPNVAGLDGFRMVAQWFANDGGGALGLSSSRAVQFELFAR